MTGPRLFVLLGSPVAHSLSPTLHAAAFRALERDAVYAAVETRPGEVAALMRAVARSGGGNVTLPHKERAASELDRASAAVEATGSCNCFWQGGDGELAGDNTDVAGFLSAVSGLIPGTGSGDEGPGRDLEGTRVLLLGAGGGARAVLHGLDRRRAERVDVLNRTPDRAEAMVRDVAGPDLEARVLRSRGELAGRYHLVVNATSLGMEPDDPLPLELDGLEAEAAFDLVYAAGGTRWVRHARELGLPARDGLEMLVRQAGASLERWLDADAPLEAVRAAARRAAGRDPGSEGAP